jgi:hypothetical protein
MNIPPKRRIFVSPLVIFVLLPAHIDAMGLPAILIRNLRPALG